MPEPQLAEAIPELKAAEFEMIRELAFRTFGLDLRGGKERLVATRLGKHLRAGGFRTFRQYYDRVKADTSGELLVSMIDSLTTNHTAFMREPSHFDFLRGLLKGDLRNRKRIDIWCAASATGEEPYTLLLTALTAFDPGLPPDVRILATDISTRALSVAKRAWYSSERLSTLPPGWASRFFDRLPDTAPGSLQVKAKLRAQVTFERVNLIEPLRVSGAYPIIFCRNVMIYFNKTTQGDVVNRLAAKLEPGGYLFIGHSESLSGVEHALQYVRPAVYRKAL
jgi:chemotaxis protein methyltransferase CheR